MSTFHGLELAKGALMAQRNALYTTGNNIANVNTEGYSRRRVNFIDRSPLQTNGTGIGTGVDIRSISRVRSKFLDMQFRAEQSRLGYWEMRADELNQMETLMNEPSENGLANVMDQFRQALKTLDTESAHSSFQSLAIQTGLSFTDTLNYLANELQTNNKEVKMQIDHAVENVNRIVSVIGDLNQQIKKIEQQGLAANDLYDERDLLVDRLGKYMNIRVHKEQSSDRAPANAEGLYLIEVVAEGGGKIGPDDGVFLLKGDTLGPGVTLAQNESGHISGIQVGDLEIPLEATGQLNALIGVFGYADAAGDIKGAHVELMNSLNEMAAVFAGAFNDLYRNGNDAGSESVFFVTKDGSDEFTAENITINTAFVKNPHEMVSEGKKFASVFSEQLFPGGTNLKGYYTSLIGKVGAIGQEADQLRNQVEMVHMHVDHTRKAVSTVSLDEEITNMIQYQHAYNAAARNLTVMDELLDVVINRMGIVGR